LSTWRKASLSNVCQVCANPQGVAYAPKADLIYIASAEDRTVDMLRAADLVAVGKIDLARTESFQLAPLHNRIDVNMPPAPISRWPSMLWECAYL
jgi:hypothetical protein